MFTDELGVTLLELSNNAPVSEVMPLFTGQANMSSRFESHYFDQKQKLYTKHYYQHGR